MKSAFIASLIALQTIGTVLLAQAQETNSISAVNTRDIPSAWLQKAKGYEKALEIQKRSGADIFVVFTREAPPDEKGLCQWFDNKGLRHNKVKKYLDNYIRVVIPLPSNPDSQKLAETFGVRKCPATFIVQPNGFQQYCKVFTWENDKMKLNEPDVLIEVFRVRSSPWYSSLK